MANKIAARQADPAQSRGIKACIPVPMVGMIHFHVIRAIHKTQEFNLPAATI